MTEAEWNACTDPRPMLKFLRGRASDRKLRLFSCACLRHVLHLVTASARRQAIGIAEQLADGIVTVKQCQEATAKADWAYTNATAQVAGDSPSQQAANRTAAAVLYANAQTVAETVAWNVPKLVDTSHPVEQVICSSFVCEIFGPLPFRPVALDHSWLTSTVTQLAAAIYEERAFDRMPILGDALEEAGCSNPDILNHCRGTGPHVRGCWVVDLLLGRE